MLHDTVAVCQELNQTKKLELVQKAYLRVVLFQVRRHTVAFDEEITLPAQHFVEVVSFQAVNINLLHNKEHYE